MAALEDLVIPAVVYEGLAFPSIGRQASSTQVPCQKGLCFMLFLIAAWPEIETLTSEQQTNTMSQPNLCATVTPINKRCVVLLDPRINYLVC